MGNEAGMSYRHYCFSVCLETFAILLIGTAIVEMHILHLANPVCYLTTIGSLIFSIGSGYYAKIIKWNRAKEQCSECNGYIKQILHLKNEAIKKINLKIKYEENISLLKGLIMKGQLKNKKYILLLKKLIKKGY